MHHVFIVEDDPLTLQRLAEHVRAHPELDVSGLAGSLAEAREQQAALLAADVLLIDLGLPDGDGTTLIGELQHAPKPPICLVITVFGDERSVVRAIEAGARGYLLKDSDESDLTALVLRAIGGDCPINPSIARHLLKRFHSQPATDANTGITARETEVLRCIARGYNNNEIGELLGMSVHTVRSHTKNIYSKLAVGSRGEAVFEATQLGLIDLKR
ncbi:MAG: response regulator transcription factor [Halioglobus sp.]|nr:response regulator transcription factor [Halioglobus sp.]